MIYTALLPAMQITAGSRKGKIMSVRAEVQYSSNLEANPYSCHLSAVHCAIDSFLPAM